MVKKYGYHVKARATAGTIEAGLFFHIELPVVDIESYKILEKGVADYLGVDIIIIEHYTLKSFDNIPIELYRDN